MEINNIYELVRICKNNDKEIKFKINNMIIDMDSFYIEDSVVYWILNKGHKNCNKKITTKEMLSWLEYEATNECWGDLYTSPMDNLGDCETKLALEKDVCNIGLRETYDIELIENEDCIILQNKVEACSKKEYLSPFCPLCEEEMNHTEFNGTHIYHHIDGTCANIMFEYVENKDLENLCKFINRE